MPTDNEKMVKQFAALGVAANNLGEAVREAAKALYELVMTWLAPVIAYLERVATFMKEEQLQLARWEDDGGSYA